MALDRDVGVAATHEPERNPAAERSGFHAGQRPNALEHPRVERAPIVGRVARGEEIEPADDNSLGLKPRRHPRRRSEAADAQAGANEQGNRQGDLRGHERAAETMAPKHPSCVSRVAERRREMGRGGQRGRSECEQEHGAYGNGCGEPQDLRVDGHVEFDRQLRRRREPDEQPHRPLEREHRAGGAETGQHDALDEQLLDNAPAACTHGQTNGNLTLPRRGARQQEPRQIRARDQQHDDGDGHQNQQDGSEHADPARWRLVEREHGRAVVDVAALAGKRRSHPLDGRIEFGASLIDGRAGREAGQNGQPSAASHLEPVAARHHEGLRAGRYPEVELSPDSPP